MPPAESRRACHGTWHDARTATSWKSGQLAFRLQRLSDVLEDVNRYSRLPIVAEDESVASLIVSGTVISDNVTGWVASLEHAFGLDAIEDDGKIVLKMAVKAPPPDGSPPASDVL